MCRDCDTVRYRSWAPANQDAAPVSAGDFRSRYRQQPPALAGAQIREKIATYRQRLISTVLNMSVYYINANNFPEPTIKLSTNRIGSSWRWRLSINILKSELTPLATMLICNTLTLFSAGCNQSASVNKTGNPVPTIGVNEHDY